MNEIEILKKKIISDLSAISDKVMLEYIAERMSLHADVARSGKTYIFDPECGRYFNDKTVDAIEEGMKEEGEAFADVDSFFKSLDE